MAAAVADYTPASGAAPAKLAKDDDTLTLHLKKTTDILGELGRRRATGGAPVLVGFAAETGELEPRARQKLTAKAVDLIIANDVSRPDRGFDVDMNAATVISATGEERLPLQSKRDMARAILDRAEALLQARVAAPQPAE
jgi:phosphopantothenoylcysteine decarboxylase/phosphopantothenate--cysteine ligase